MQTCDVLRMYRERLAAQEVILAALDREHIRLGNAQLATAGAAVLLLVLTYGPPRLLTPAWLLVPAAVFVLVAIRHDRVLQARRRAERIIGFYRRGIDRLTGAWAGSGENGARFASPDHLYEADLDLFGPGSLFQLITTARLRAGDETLAHWLKAPAPLEEITARQEAVRELAPRLDLREELALLGEEVAAGVRTERLVAWGAQPPVRIARWEPWAAALLVAATAGVLITWAVTGAAGGWVAAALLVQAIFALSVRRRARMIHDRAEEPAHDLQLMAGVLELFERQQFQSPKLQSLERALAGTGQTASRRIGQLRLLVDLIESQHNQFFAPAAALLLWGTQLAFALERWRTRSGPHLATWLDVIGQFEALCSLASYAFEHPDDPCPSLSPDGPLFDARGLGHPLIPADRLVRNDVRLDGQLRLLVVSGSNMSGKTTLLRAVGVNVVLALAGAPVRAHALTLSPLAIGASLRVVDSLQAGQSKFYAEITRLRAIVALTEGPLPVLFLLDELLSGTNSHDRRIGAEGIVRTLLDRNAIGLLTTHDLALSAVADSLGPAAANVHFADEFDAGGLRFDYRMRPGVVRSSNALALMRAVGLEVDAGR
ncbi:MAG TPA: hypothetical protein VNK41_02650 [Vicinamibacterales bacterium]|nr:hypothetical protein [Vicinamibacterales bacterium]